MTALVFLLTATSQTEELEMRVTNVQQDSIVVIVSYVNNKQTWTYRVDIKSIPAEENSNNEFTVTSIGNASALVALVESIVATKVQEEILTENNNPVESYQTIA